MDHCLRDVGLRVRSTNPGAPTQWEVAEACIRANKNIIRINHWTMCRNLEWLVCAAQGSLPGQGGRDIQFHTAPKDLRLDHVEPSPSRRGGSGVVIVERPSVASWIRSGVPAIAARIGISTGSSPKTSATSTSS